MHKWQPLTENDVWHKMFFGPKPHVEYITYRDDDLKKRNEINDWERSRGRERAYLIL